ncbi:MAG: VOC family protein [Syntrophorhabdales bacterium]|jgi:methylmalonyl-CoA/ethylmalonyl-CoA epimerase
MADKPMFTQVMQIGLVVKDCDASVKRWVGEYGIGPWQIYEFNPETVGQMTLHGKYQGYAMRLATTTVGSVQLELIEPKDDKSIYAEFLREHGEGLHHVAFGVEDYGRVLESYDKKGEPVLQGGSWNGLTYTYLDLRKDLGLIAEIYDIAPDFQLPEPVAVYPEKA